MPPANEKAEASTKPKDASKDKDAAADKEKTAEEKAEEQFTPSQQTFKTIRDHIYILERAVQSKETRLFLRAIRGIGAVRPKISRPLLQALSEQYNLHAELDKYISESYLISSKVSTNDKNKGSEKMVVESEESKKDDDEDEPTILDSLRRVFSPIYHRARSLDILSGQSKPTPGPEKPEPEPQTPPVEALPEVRAYIHLLIVIFLFDQKHYEAAASCVSDLVAYLHSFNRRTLDWLSAKIYSFYDLTHDKTNQLAEIRTSLLSAHRSAVLQHNEPGQAALNVAILHNYVHYHLYSQADTFRLKSTFPESRSNNLLARYLYYTALINSVQLQYSDAYNSVAAALRKAPQKKAIGFRQRATKLLVIVQLLMGDIPDRTLFNSNDLRHSLVAYLQLTRAVRVGDLAKFTEVMNKFSDNFEKDGMNTLIVRLRHNVIKAGLRKINLAYSAISLKDIAKKLNLESALDAESIVVKAISDGVIDATVDHDTGVVQSKDTTDLYSTAEPQQTFNKRIDFCLQIHNDAVKAMRFPPNAHKRGEYFDEDEDDEDEEGNSLSRKKKEEKADKEEKKDDKDKKDDKKSEKKKD